MKVERLLPIMMSGDRITNGAPFDAPFVYTMLNNGIVLLFFLPGKIPLQKYPFILHETIIADRLAYLCHHLQVKMDIVDSRKYGRNDLVGRKQVVKIGAGEILAGVTAAAGINREEVTFVVFVGQADSAAPGKKCGATGITGWYDAVKHVDAAFDTFQYILR